MISKRFKITAILVFACCVATFTSCESNPENNARSIHVDSTNESGTAPVRYGADNPADTTSRLPSSDDTGRRSNTEQR